MTTSHSEHEEEEEVKEDSINTISPDTYHQIDDNFTKDNNNSLTESNEKSSYVIKRGESMLLSNKNDVSNKKKKRRDTEMTIEDCIDMDVDILTSTIENSCQQLKREFLNQFVEARKRIKERGMVNLEVQREEYEASLQTKQEEINILKCEIKGMTEKEERINDILNRALNEIYKININKRIWN